MMKYFFYFLLAIHILCCTPETSVVPKNFKAKLLELYEIKKSNIWVQGNGEVIKILPDDLKGSKHQLFILRVSNKQTILIAHNIDLAPKIMDLQVGEKVEFYGEYEWNSKGGVVHWTHHDPKGKKQGGWLKHNGKVYE